MYSGVRCKAKLLNGIITVLNVKEFLFSLGTPEGTTEALMSRR